MTSYLFISNANELITVAGHSNAPAKKERMNEILAERTGQPIEVIERDTDRDNFMTASQAVDYGLIDKVLERKE